MKRIVAITVVLTGLAMLLGFGVTDSTEASNNFQPTSNEAVWNEFVERQVFFEADTDAGFFELQFEEIVGRLGETERTLEICSSQFQGFICQAAEVDEGEMNIDFGFPFRDSTARIVANVDGCGDIDLEIVLTPDQAYESFKSMEFSSDGKLTRVVMGVEAHSKEAIMDVDVRGTICDLVLSPDNVSEASHGMKEEHNREREED